MDNCIFCKIIKEEIDSAKVWENEEFLAILDAFPNTKGMTLVMSKGHYDSYAFDLPKEVYNRFFEAAKQVARLLEKTLRVKRVVLVMEGLGVNHAHIKLYPVHGLDEKFKEIIAPEKKFFEKYQGYVSTQPGPQADLEELKNLAEEIRQNTK